MRFAIFAPAAALLVALPGCWLDPCDNEVVAEVPSPDGLWKAVAFNRHCGATTSDSTHVSLLPRNAALPRAGGNVAVLDSGHHDVELRVVMRWSSADELEVRHDPRVRWFRQDAEHEGVHVRYLGTR